MTVKLCVQFPSFPSLSPRFADHHPVFRRTSIKKFLERCFRKYRHRCPNADATLELKLHSFVDVVSTCSQNSQSFARISSRNTRRSSSRSCFSIFFSLEFFPRPLIKHSEVDAESIVLAFFFLFFKFETPDDRSLDLILLQFTRYSFAQD